jgi:hypothetical protein
MIVMAAIKELIEKAETAARDSATGAAQAGDLYGLEELKALYVALEFARRARRT